MKKKICLLIALVHIFLCIAGCGGGNDTPEATEDPIIYAYPVEEPSYVDDQQMEMIAFWSPPSTLEQYQWMVDCGFTSVIIDVKYDNNAGSQTLMDTLAICDQVGIKAYLIAGRGQNADLSTDYSKFESFAGFYTDEPLSKEDFDVIETNTEGLKIKYPEKGYNYWTTLICDAPTAYNSDFPYWEDYYNYYFDGAGKDQKAFLFDHYPLCGNSAKGIISADWLHRTEQYAALAKEKGYDMMPYIATMGYSSGNRRKPAEDDIRYQIYVNLAYGAKGIAYFCYMSPGVPPYDGEFKPSDYALINYEDVNDFSTYFRTEAWDNTQTVNMEMKELDHVLLSFDWEGVMKCAGSEATTTAGKNNFSNAKNWIKKHDGIKKLTSTEDTIVGVFKDENGYDGFMLVNFSDPLYDASNTVTMELRGATRAVVYIKGQKQIVNLTDGTYTVTLEPGEGQFIIPLA